MRKRFSLAIHGGAGAIQDLSTYRSSLLKVMRVGEGLLSQGKSAVTVVERCVAMLENDPLYNAGKGSVLNERGKVEMDAAIMDGSGLRCGAVAAVSGVKNPVKLARFVMDKSKHVMLIGSGAVQFGRLHKVQMEKDAYFIVPRRLEQWKQAKSADRVALDHSTAKLEHKFGTVGAVAFDTSGTVAAATSTGGVVNKKYGRVGDTPIIGCGTYADNATCAVSATGYGEFFIRTAFAKHVADLIRYKKYSAEKAVMAAVNYLSGEVKGLGGAIVVDCEGNVGAAYNTPSLLYGYVKSGMKAGKLGF